jgi:Putative serine dehydratase domain
VRAVQPDRLARPAAPLLAGRRERRPRLCNRAPAWVTLDPARGGGHGRSGRRRRPRPLQTSSGAASSSSWHCCSSERQSRSRPTIRCSWQVSAERRRTRDVSWVSSSTATPAWAEPVSPLRTRRPSSPGDLAHARVAVRRPAHLPHAVRSARVPRGGSGPDPATRTAGRNGVGRWDADDVALGRAASPRQRYRAGTYAFNDRNTVASGAATLDEVALTVAATVFSRRGDRAIIDAGSKALSSERAADPFGLAPEAPGSRWPVERGR